MHRSHKAGTGLGNRRWISLFIIPNLHNGLQPTLGPAYNVFGYYEHSAIMNNFFLSEKNTSDWQCLKSLVITNIAYNEHILPPTTKLGQGYIFTGICDSVHGGRYLGRYPPPPRPGAPPGTRFTPSGPGTPQEIRVTSGQYASYWNAFLSWIKLLVVSGTQCMWWFCHDFTSSLDTNYSPVSVD